MVVWGIRRRSGLVGVSNAGRNEAYVRLIFRRVRMGPLPGPVFVSEDVTTGADVGCFEGVAKCLSWPVSTSGERL
jgi:hypothetical protein